MESLYYIQLLSQTDLISSLQADQTNSEQVKNPADGFGPHPAVVTSVKEVRAGGGGEQSSKPSLCCRGDACGGMSSWESTACGWALPGLELGTGTPGGVSHVANLSAVL